MKSQGYLQTESAWDNMSSSEIEAITSVLHAYGTALKERNVKETVALYTSDGVIMPPHFSASAGSQALIKTYERIFNSIQLTITFDIDEIVLMSPDWAFARTTAEGTKTMLQTQTSEPHSNQELFIMKKEDGSWKIARYAFSTMKPLVQDGIRRS
ncbi:uncharacterized protein FOBCDRAFT_209630 [Fusarium oxysporum Fo47]|uniref:uncharacterized protein n=1 Tax=Fusarium oxysporum Fo47 TaxID=660027 RepID=UPI002869CED3|nr:uncharacterized protein FOBCDRAFT_209630 [Fusarium oxysporum Fo47]QKD62949.2 hypothetical protein FOBCDRAFT_209630 [Fusarium oxysporum Fo47]